MSPKINASNINLIAVALLAGILLAVLAILRVSPDATMGLGPRAMATDDSGRTALVLGREIMLIAADGGLETRIDSRALGVTGTVSDIAPLGDNRWLLALGSERAVARCDFGVPKCIRLFGLRSPALPGFAESFDLAADASRKRVYVADAPYHRVDVYGLGGELEASWRGEDPSFIHPNGPWLAGDGRLAIADTNNHRIALLSLDADRAGRVSESCRVGTGLARPGHSWPFEVRRSAAGDWWVINAGPFMNDGDVLIFDEDCAAKRRIDLPDDAEPVALLPYGDVMVVADKARIALPAFDDAGRRRGDFGGPALAAALAELHGIQTHSRVLRALSWATVAVLGAGLVGLLVLARRRGLLQTRATLAPPDGTASYESAAGRPSGLAPSSRTIVLTPDPRLRVLAKRVLLLSLVPAPVIVGVALLYFQSPSPAFVLSLFLAFAAGLGLAFFALTRTSIRIRGDQVRLEDHRGDVATGGPDRLRYSRNLLAIGDVVVWVSPRPPKPLYDPQAFEHHLRPVLRRARPLSRLETIRALLRSRHPQVAVHVLLLLPLIAWALAGTGPG